VVKGRGGRVFWQGWAQPPGGLTLTKRRAEAIKCNQVEHTGE